MNQLGEEKKQQEPDGFTLAGKLREEARLLEDKEQMKRRLLELIEISEDPYYDQYLKQMIKDLESGKATPGQVKKEVDRTSQLYLQRTGKIAVTQEHNTANKSAVPIKQKDTVEFKIGAGIFSTVGAVFILVALVILGFYYLEGIWQGLCLYAVSLTIVLISELFIKRFSRPFSFVTTGIGISSLFISTVINYLVLENVNGLIASVITLIISIFAIMISRKKDAASIRLITIFGCYISFLPIKGFDSELSFLIMAGMLLMINLASVFLPNQSNRRLINCVHIVAHTVFTGIVTGIVLQGNINTIYVACFVIISLVLLNLIYWQQREDNEYWFSVVFSVAVGFCACFLIWVACFNHGLSPELEIFHKFLTEIMAIAVAVIFFILAGQRKERWIQYYFIAAIIVMFNGFSNYKLEVMIGVLAIFILTRILSIKTEEIAILDGILAVVTALQGLWYIDDWCAIPYVIVLLFSVLIINKLVIFHEINITVFLILAVLLKLDTNWTLPLSMGILFVLFLLFNHLPILKKHSQQPYNIVNLCFAGIISLCSVFLDNYWINIVTIILGVIMILIVFRERYQLYVPKKYFVVIGYLVYMILVAGFTSSFIVSGLLMVVAIVSIAIGFKLKDKNYRICGLGIAVLVCIKLILFDFRELESLSKALLFLMVGVIALVISFLYIYIEKKEEQEEKAASELIQAEVAENEEVQTQTKTAEAEGEQLQVEVENAQLQAKTEGVSFQSETKESESAEKQIEEKGMV